MLSVQFNDFSVSLCVSVVKINHGGTECTEDHGDFCFGPGVCLRTATRDILAMRQDPRGTRMLMVKDGRLKR
jgi:hypothetical protein